MSLALQHSYISQNDLISINSIVRRSGDSILYIVKAISKDRKSACITSEDGHLHWIDVNALVYVSHQGDLFHA